MIKNNRLHFRMFCIFVMKKGTTGAKMKPEYEELLNNFERYLDSMSQTEFDSIVDSMAKERDNGESFGFDLSLDTMHGCFLSSLAANAYSNVSLSVESDYNAPCYVMVA
ncbi:MULTISPECIES: hypothetical protein [Hallerella]|nr:MULTISPECIES: hypothetical protein [Hallerella]MCI6873743.1 hypothetical protein [Hallerella sp.]MDD6091206.1 hypothetical protein [Hallerella succinigenes]